MGLRENASDSRGGSGPVSSGAVDVVQLTDQFQFEAAIRKGFAPDLQRGG
jgi:hypothetical protein